MLVKIENRLDAIGLIAVLHHMIKRDAEFCLIKTDEGVRVISDILFNKETIELAEDGLLLCPTHSETDRDFSKVSTLKNNLRTYLSPTTFENFAMDKSLFKSRLRLDVKELDNKEIDELLQDLLENMDTYLRMVLMVNDYEETIHQTIEEDDSDPLGFISKTIVYNNIGEVIGKYSYKVSIKPKERIRGYKFYIEVIDFEHSLLIDNLKFILCDWYGEEFDISENLWESLIKDSVVKWRLDKYE